MSCTLIVSASAALEKSTQIPAAAAATLLKTFIDQAPLEIAAF
jgi:hypothetical protein